MLVRSALVLLLLAPTLARADAIDVALKNRVPKGSTPALVVKILEPIAGFRVTLTRDDGQTFDWKGGGKPGTARTLDLTQATDKAHWKGELTLNELGGQTGSMPLEFDTELLGPLKLTIDKEKDVDFEHRAIHFSLNRPVAKVHLKVMTEAGEVAVDDDIDFMNAPANTRQLLTWGPTFARAMKVDVRAYDDAKFYDSIELTAWQLAIPHEEVTFESGKADLLPGETPKLDASFELIRQAVLTYGALAPLRLFIAGHTDTVGASDANRALSVDRAHAIAAYFRQKGLRSAIFYEGFGEEALLVATPDETDEPKNRRAEYIVSIDEPVGRLPFKPSWRRLPDAPPPAKRPQKAR